MSENKQQVNIKGIGIPGGGSNARFKAVVKPKDFKSTLQELWKYFGGEKKLLLLIFIFVLCDSLLTLVAPYLIGKGVDGISNGQGLSAISVILFALGSAYFTIGILQILEGWLMVGISQRVLKTMRATLFKKLQSLPVRYFDTRPNGEVMSRFTNDIDQVSSILSQSTLQMMSSVITISGSFIMMLYLSPILTVLSIVTIPLVFLLTRTIAKRTKVFFKGQQNVLGGLNGQIEETISGFEIVKVFNHEGKVIEEFKERNEKLREVGLKAQVWSGLLMPLMNVISNLGFVIVASAGGYLAIQDAITVGVIASVISYSKQFTRPISDLASLFNQFQSAVAGAERVFEVMAEVEEPRDQLTSLSLDNPQGNVVFENVTFGYNSQNTVLKNVSFEAEAGSHIALVGPTGAGKTTIVNLLTRFYDVNEGRILIDGLDIRDYIRDDLRKSIGFVLQDTYVFQGTILENIRYGRLEATREEVVEAAKLAHAHGFIRRLPKGYDTVLLNNGSNISHGQRQLLTIARAILAQPRILILDEATSSVDTRTEKQIQKAMLQVMKGRTSFVIAHRLSTIRDASTIMVMNGGEIVESGNHDELMAIEGMYYEMCMKQFQNIDD